ncbi:hypothetical protein GTR05_004961 [Salmonella enterica]|nr:hypothetical protein [Salmonella enterica]
MNNQLIMGELLSSVEEVLAISDRKHDAWDRARAAIAHYRAAAQPVSAALDSSICKYCGGSGYFRWQESANMMPCPCVGCATAPDKGPAMPVVCFVSTPNGSEDTSRLDWLDAQNKRLNEYYGTSYGWKFDANFQRNAMMLNDSNYPVMDVRQAIDEAIAAAPRQEQRIADREASKDE